MVTILPGSFKETFIVIGPRTTLLLATEKEIPRFAGGGGVSSVFISLPSVVVVFCSFVFLTLLILLVYRLDHTR